MKMTDRYTCICLTCLSRDTKMCSILNTPLPKFYEKLANIQLSEDEIPKTICYICYSQLQKCYNFMEMSQKAGKILTQLFIDAVQINQETEIPDIKRTNNFVKITLEPISVSCDNKEDEEVIERSNNKIIINAIDDEVHRTKTKVQLKLEGIDTQIVNEEQLVTVKEELITVEIKPSTSAPEKEANVSYKEEITKGVKAAIQSQIKDENYMEAIPAPKDYSNMSMVVNKNEKKGSKNNKEKNHVCNRCGKAFTHDYYLQRHMVTHTGEKRYPCKTCHKRFSQNGHLVQHMRLHTGESLYICDICYKEYSHRYNFKVHMKKHSNCYSNANDSQLLRKEKSQKCNLCSSAFYHRGELQRHMRAHTGEKPFICDTCDAKFSQKGHLRDHIRTHTNQKPYICNFCSLAFAQKCYLNNHLAKHTGGKLFPCTYPGCHKSFQSKSTYANHLRVHTGERPFACGKCNKTYKQRGHLTTHISAIHAREEIESDLLAATKT